jgi:hypothetical protein
MRTLSSSFSVFYFLLYRTSFLEKAFLCLKENYGALFDSVALKSNLLVMFSGPDMAKDCN